MQIPALHCPAYEGEGENSLYFHSSLLGLMTTTTKTSITMEIHLPRFACYKSFFLLFRYRSYTHTAVRAHAEVLNNKTSICARNSCEPKSHASGCSECLVSCQARGSGCDIRSPAYLMFKQSTHEKQPISRVLA